MDQASVAVAPKSTMERFHAKLGYLVTNHRLLQLPHRARVSLDGSSSGTTIRCASLYPMGLPRMV